MAWNISTDGALAPSRCRLFAALQKRQQLLVDLVLQG
jgi:hypothetical protein